MATIVPKNLKYRLVGQPKGYCTIAQIEAYLLHSIKDYFEPEVVKWIIQMERFVEKETGRIFIADGVASVKKYQIEQSIAIRVGRYIQTEREIVIDDCIEVSELKIDGAVVSTSDYLLYPTNSLPKTRIKLRDDSGLGFTKGEQNIEVKAKWGYSEECPPDVSFATLIFVVGIINFSGGMSGEIKSEKLGDYSIVYKDKKDWQDFERAKQILQQYRKLVV